VYDRIRENLKIQLREPLPQVINNSINEVLSRTIITSLTVFLAAAALFFLGGEVIHDFAFIILLGLLSAPIPPYSLQVRYCSCGKKTGLPLSKSSDG